MFEYFIQRFQAAAVLKFTDYNTLSELKIASTFGKGIVTEDKIPDSKMTIFAASEP